MLSEFISELWRQLGAASEQIKALTAVTAATLAFVGLRTWRLQLKGTAEYTLAKEVLKAAYRVREAFKHVRNPAIFSYEYPESMREETGHLKDQFRAEGTAHVYEERFKVLNDAFRVLEDRTLDAKVEWGSHFAVLIMPLRKLRAELLMAVQDHVQAIKPGRERRRTTVDEMREARSVMYYLGEDQNELDRFTPETNGAIAEFEKRLRPIVGARKG
jgi:hypothetical protein